MLGAGRADGARVKGWRGAAAIVSITVALASAWPAAGAAGAAGASPAAQPVPAPPAPAPPPGVVLAPERADEAGRRQAQGELAVAERALRAATADHKRLARKAAALEQRVRAAAAGIEGLAAEDTAAAAQLAKARERVRRMAIAGYVAGGQAAPVDYLLRARDPVDLSRRQSLFRRAVDAKADALDAYEAARAATSEQLHEALAARDLAASEQRQAASAVAAAAERTAMLRAEADHRRLLLQVVTAAAPVPPSDVPRLFLDAYRKGAASVQRRQPRCKVPWTVLASIGRVESNHGRYGGARLALNGDVFPRILGIPLDGTRSRLIKDSDKGELDGDTTFDRAVGPMQFLPSTWKRVGMDGNADGKLDANNAYDAAAGAAAYLCRAVPEGGLDREEALRRAVYSYNHSKAYVDTVVGWMRTFEAVAPSLPL
jgi:membrane-bound lytic murein transglycosylase B